MEGLFVRALNVSIASVFLVSAIIIYRIFAKESPKWVSVLLWGLVGARLIFPFNIESALSLVPSKNTFSEQIAQERFPSLDTGFELVDEVLNPIISSAVESHPEYGARPAQDLINAACRVWLAGIICLLLYMAVSSVYLRIKMGVRVEKEKNVYLCDGIKTPFILGTVKPKIYLPSDICERDYSFAVAHERAHIKRLDHIWKPLGFLLLAFYWFNPILWVAYLLLCRDIESACDERVISSFDGIERAAYSEALLNLGVKSRPISACPLAFGEVSVKSRVVAISEYKKPEVLAIIVSLCICAVFSACFLTYRKNEAVSVEKGIWFAEKAIASVAPDVACESVPRLVFTENGDVLSEASGLEGISYRRLGKMNAAYVSREEYGELLAGLALSDGYGADFFYGTVKSAWRIPVSVSSGVDCEEIYLLKTEKRLYAGYAKGGRISSLYEMRFSEIAPTYLYNVQYTSQNTPNTSLILNSRNGTGQVTFGDDINYTAPGIFKYENSKLIFKTVDSFEMKLVFFDVGDALVYSEKDSDLGGFKALLPDETSFRGYYSLCTAAPASIAFDIDGDNRSELIFADVDRAGNLRYLIHRRNGMQEGTVPFDLYDLVELRSDGKNLYLVCESGDGNAPCRYKVELFGENLVFSREEE